MKSQSAWFENGTEKARKLKNEKSKRLIKSAILGNADIFVVLNIIERKYENEIEFLLFSGYRNRIKSFTKKYLKCLQIRKIVL